MLNNFFTQVHKKTSDTIKPNTVSQTFIQIKQIGVNFRVKVYKIIPANYPHKKYPR
jgi:hypothetical protein